VLLGRRHSLPNGLRVCLRLPHPGEGRRLRELHLRIGREADELDLSRIARFDPHRRVTICATVLAGTAEVLVGYATAEIDRAAPAVVVDERLAPGLRTLLGQALKDRLAAARHVA